MRALVKRLLRASMMAKATVALHSAASLLMIIALITWSPDRSPRWVLAVFVATSAVTVGYVMWRGSALSKREVHVLTAALLLGVGTLTWLTGTDLGAFANGAVLPLLGMYVMWFLPGIGGRSLLYIGTLWWFWAIVERGDHLLTALSISLIGQVVLAAEVLSAVHRQSERVARVDVLTGVGNRRAVAEACELHLARLAGRGTPFSIISIDLDGLRSLNNAQGHRAGDELLMHACRDWQRLLGLTDVLGRIGGDEFVIVLPGASAVDARALERRMRGETLVSWSAGVAQARTDDDVPTLMHRADQRMYAQKAERSELG